MARGGGKRNYVRDANGRFASTPGGGASSLGAARKANSPGARRKTKAQATGGTLAARTSLKKSKAKLSSMASPASAQKGAVTRGNNLLRAAMKTSQKRLESSKNTIAKPRNLKPGEIAKSREVDMQSPKSTQTQKPSRIISKKQISRSIKTIAKPRGLKPDTRIRDGLLQKMNNSKLSRSTQPKTSFAPSKIRASKPKGTIASPYGISPKASPTLKSKRQFVQASAKAVTKNIKWKRSVEQANKPVKRNRFLDAVARQILIATGQIKRKGKK